MSAILAWLISNPLGRKVGLATLAVLLLAGAGYAAYRHGIARGRVVGRAEQLEVDQQAWEQDRAQYLAVLRAAEKEISATRELVIQYQAALAAAKSKIDALDLEQENVRRAVARIPDRELLSDIRARLSEGRGGLRPPEGAPNAPLTAPESPITAGELRACDEAIAELPIVLQKVARQGEMIQISGARQAELEKENRLITRQRDEAVDYANRLEARYVAAYNVAQQARKRPLILKILTFGLLKDRKATLPPPITLKSVTP